MFPLCITATAERKIFLLRAAMFFIAAAAALFIYFSINGGSVAAENHEIYLHDPITETADSSSLGTNFSQQLQQSNFRRIRSSSGVRLFQYGSALLTVEYLSSTVIVQDSQYETGKSYFTYLDYSRYALPVRAGPVNC